MSSTPKRDGIAEILESGRAPGFAVRGGTPRGDITRLPSPMFDFRGRPVTPDERIREDIANMRAKSELHRKAKRARGSSKKGTHRLIGSVPISYWRHLTKETGGDSREARRLAKERGFFFED